MKKKIRIKFVATINRTNTTQIILYKLIFSFFFFADPYDFQILLSSRYKYHFEFRKCSLIIRIKSRVENVPCRDIIYYNRIDFPALRTLRLDIILTVYFLNRFSERFTPSDSFSSNLTSVCPYKRVLVVVTRDVENFVNDT